MYKLVILSSLILFGKQTTQQQPETNPQLLTSLETVADFNEGCCNIQNVVAYDEIFDLNSLVYVEEEAEVEMDYQVEWYLPKNFDAYVGSINEIQYIDIEKEETVELGFDTKQYLPINFNPLALDVNSIQYIQEEPEIIMGYDTKKYLPKGFDPYVGNLNDLKYIDFKKEGLLNTNGYITANGGNTKSKSDEVAK